MDEILGYPPGMRLLLVEDSVRLGDAVATGLRKSGYAVDVSVDGKTGLWQAQSHDYDVIILDLMLPGIDGLSLLAKLREAGRQTHVLVVTAKDTVDDRVRGLRAGADDYLIKPFAFDELLARVEALVRRRHVAKSTVIHLRDLVIDTAARTVSRGGVVLELPSRQYSLLEYLLLRRGTVVSRTEIEAHLYDALAEPMSNVVDAAVYALRKRVDVPGQPSLIQTRRGMGYVLVADEGTKS
jgi:DNA-binding response OmpR family regulator